MGCTENKQIKQNHSGFNLEKMKKLKLKISVCTNIPRSEEVEIILAIIKKHYGESVKFSILIYLGHLEHFNNTSMEPCIFKKPVFFK